MQNPAKAGGIYQPQAAVPPTGCRAAMGVEANVDSHACVGYHPRRTGRRALVGKGVVSRERKRLESMRFRLGTIGGRCGSLEVGAFHGGFSMREGADR